MDLSGLNEMAGNGTEYSSIPIRDKDDPQNYFVFNSIDRTYYVLNGEWTLLNTPGLRVVKEFDGSPYHELFFYIRIRRLTLAYALNLIIPSLLISVMTVLGFTLPPGSCEKITLETTVLLSIMFFLGMISNMSPPSSDAFPILAAFFFCCLMVVSASVVFTVLVLNLHQRKPETHEMGPVMRYLLLDLLPYIIMLKRPKQESTHRRPLKELGTLLPLPVQKEVDIGDEFSKLLCTNLCKRCSNGRQKCDENENGKLSEVGVLRTIKKSVGEMCRMLSVINEDLVSMNEYLDEQFVDNQLESDWRFAAMVVDRLCLYLFSVFIVLSTSVLALPHFMLN